MQDPECEEKSATRHTHDEEELDMVMSQLDDPNIHGDDRIVVQAQLVQIAIDDQELFIELQPEERKQRAIAACKEAFVVVKKNEARIPGLLKLSKPLPIDWEFVA